MSPQTTEIEQLIHTYVGYSATMDFESKKALWDLSEPRPLLSPEEELTPLVGWDQLDAYWAKSRTVMTDLNSSARDIAVIEVEPGVVLATYTMRWIARLAGPNNTPGPPLGADVRVSSLLRLTQEGWRFIFLMEGPVDLETMVRQSLRG